MNFIKCIALQWAKALFSSHFIDNLWFDTFLQKFLQVFNHLLHWEYATKRIMSLRKGKQTVAEHFINFWVMAKEVRWNEEALKGVVINSLSNNLKGSTGNL